MYIYFILWFTIQHYLYFAAQNSSALAIRNSLKLVPFDRPHSFFKQFFNFLYYKIIILYLPQPFVQGWSIRLLVKALEFLAAKFSAASRTINWAVVFLICERECQHFTKYFLFFEVFLNLNLVSFVSLYPLGKGNSGNTFF